MVGKQNSDGRGLGTKIAAAFGVGEKRNGQSGGVGKKKRRRPEDRCKRSSRPHAKLDRRTERGLRTVVANMNIWIADSDIGGPPDRALGPGPAHEETLPWAWARPGPWPFRVPGPWVH